MSKLTFRYAQPSLPVARMPAAPSVPDRHGFTQLTHKLKDLVQITLSALCSHSPGAGVHSRLPLHCQPARGHGRSCPHDERRPPVLPVCWLHLFQEGHAPRSAHVQVGWQLLHMLVSEP